jgi:hypothetical protein
MTITDLQQRLSQRISQLSEPGKLEFPKPQRLERYVEVLQRILKDAGTAMPPSEKLLNAINRLEQLGPEQLTRRDWRNVAWGLSVSFKERPQKLLFSHSGGDALHYLKISKADLIPSIYLPLLFSYFGVDKEELSISSSNWLLLREMLEQFLPELYLRFKTPKSWMLVLSDFIELLQAQPTARLSQELINNPDEKKIPELATILQIPSNSWFWDKIIRDGIKFVTSLSDDLFKQKIERLLSLAEKNPRYAVTILSAVLDRYAASKYRDVIDDRLKNAALAQWGNPQYTASAGWSNVQEDTKKMVIQWFVRADLEAFFNLFSDYADINRFHYWMGFIKQISASQLFLSPDALASSQSERRKFIELNRSQLKDLMGSTSTNNAFCLKIGNLYVVDFSDTGNACYIYKEMPYQQKTRRAYLTDLKNKFTCLKSMNHSGAWENKFNQALAQQGIFPDAHNGRSTNYRRN